MKIAVNTRFLLKDYLEGYGIVIVELFKRIVVNNPQHEFYFLFDRPYDESFVFAENVKPVVVAPPARHPILWTWWYNIKVPAELKKIKADVFVSPDSFCSTTTKVPQLLMVHDLAFLHYPKFISKAHLRFYKNKTPRFLKKAKRIVTVSEFSKQDIIQHYSTPVEKIKVIYNGAREIFKPLSYEERRSVKDQYADGKEYFIYVGSIHPRKNPFHLLKAFSVFKKRMQSDMKLLIVGRLAWQFDDFIKRLDNYKYREDVKLLNHVNGGELARLVGAAYAMLYPSYFEGFGLPIAEAMKAHVPVICSNVSSMPEVAGGAALLANPDSFEDIAEQMMLLYKDENLRSSLISKGAERVKAFNWDTAAEEFWKEIVATAQA